jgi:hypothetical protein
MSRFLHWLTPRRLRAQAMVLAICLWGVCAVDFTNPGVFDRAGNIKFQDFLPIYISSRMITQHHEGDLYDATAQALAMRSILNQHSSAEVPYLYGPQVGLLFVPFARFPFQAAAWIWATVSMLLYFVCIYAVWKTCIADMLRHRLASRSYERGAGSGVDRTNSDKESASAKLQSHAALIAVAAIAYPPLFHVFVRAQLSALVLVCFTGAFLAVRANRNFLAGVVLGFLIFKPQFLVAIPLVLLLAGAWSVLSALILSAAAQLALTRLYFGASVLQSYFDVLLHPSRWIGSAELNLAPIQMHSLRSFFTLLIPSPTIAIILYGLISLAAVVIAAMIWKSNTPLSLRFAALTLAAILVNPHLFVYDLLVLAPTLFSVIDWTLKNPSHASVPKLQFLIYLAYVLPLFGPLSRWTHLQVSVIAFSVLLWILFCFATAGHKLASSESSVV